MSTSFLPAALVQGEAVAAREWQHYIPHFWHPLAALAALPPGHSQAVDLAGIPVLLTHPPGAAPLAFRNRCPHRAVALQEPGPARPCRRLVCPYHGWSYSLTGQLEAAAREADFLDPFERQAWPLSPLPCQVKAGLVWVALGPEVMALEQQLDLVLQEAAEQLEQPRLLLAQAQRPLACNWKIAHDNTLDDYHVAIAHPTTLHREQGPVRLYRHALSRHGTLLATPWQEAGAAGEFLTFGLAPWIHLLLWPDGRLALIAFPPTGPDRCRMDVLLLGPERFLPDGEALMAQLQTFLEEDRRLVEAAQAGYSPDFIPGPPHRLEQRIVQQQALYRDLMGLPA